MISWIKREIRGMDIADIMFHVFAVVVVVGLLTGILLLAPVEFLLIIVIGAVAAVVMGALYAAARFLRWWAR